MNTTRRKFSTIGHKGAGRDIVALARRLHCSPLWLRLETDAERLALARLHRSRIMRSPCRVWYDRPYRHRGRSR